MGRTKRDTDKEGGVGTHVEEVVRWYHVAADEARVVAGEEERAHVATGEEQEQVHVVVAKAHLLALGEVHLVVVVVAVVGGAHLPAADEAHRLGVAAASRAAPRTVAAMIMAKYSASYRRDNRRPRES